MQFNLEDTIAALASPPGPARRGILRVTGNEVARCVEGWFDPADAKRWRGARLPQRHAGELVLSRQQVRVPVALHYWPTGRSYTGQPMIEVHTIGSPPLLEEILAELYRRGVRPAQRGEFTLRAFLAGRLDLLRAEAVLGVIDAQDHEELAAALKQLAGGVSDRIAAVRQDLILLLADLEAGLDFVEEDIEFVEREDLLRRLRSARGLFEQYLAQTEARTRAGEKLRVVLAGLPNAGKSSLFNALTQQSAALVSPRRGTTRDYLSAAVRWEGLELELIDTAGWENLTAGIEGLAQSQRHEQSLQADLILWCRACDLSPEEARQDEELRRQLRDQFSRPVLGLLTKADLPEASGLPAGDGWIAVSVSQQDSLREIRQRVPEMLTDPHRGERQLLGSTAARCRESLEHAITSLTQAETSAELGLGDEITALEIRAALQHLARILGQVYTDDLLDQIFSRFCIGK